MTAFTRSRRYWFSMLAAGLVLTAPIPLVWAQSAPAAPDQASVAAPATLSPPMAMDSAAQRVPAGVNLPIRMVTAIDARTARPGDIFIAAAAQDLYAGQQLLLPRGTVVRGRVATAQKPGFFSKGGLLRLDFDHVQMPSGELRPLDLQVDAFSAKMSREKNALYTDPGVGAKLDASVDKGVDKFKYFHEKGVAAGKARGGGANMLLTVPTNTIAGVATGTAITAANAAKAVFGRGESVVLNPGDELLIDFSQATTLEAQ